MAAWNETDVSHIGFDILEKHTHRQWPVIGVWPELDVLVPLDFLAASGRFEVEFAVVELDVGSE